MIECSHDSVRSSREVFSVDAMGQIANYWHWQLSLFRRGNDPTGDNDGMISN